MVQNQKVELGHFLLPSFLLGFYAMACVVVAFLVWRELPASHDEEHTLRYRHFATFELAIKEAKKLKKPIFLDLYADWCHPCKKLARETFPYPSISRLLKHYLVVKFNIETPYGRALLRHYRVRRFPTTLMLDSNGRELERVVGYYSPRYFRPAILAALRNKDRFVQLYLRYKHSPNDLIIIHKLADRALLRRQIVMARALYQKMVRIDRFDVSGGASLGLFGIARSWVRIGRYYRAFPYLREIHRQFPKSKIRIDAYRLELYCNKNLRRHKRYKKLLATFHRLYGHQTIKFK